MINFKQFLESTANGEQINISALDIEGAIDTLNTHCKNALWMLEKNSPLYRGDPRTRTTGGFAIIDLTTSTRKSENTSNYYTEIFDNIPSMSKFPKRSKSLICSTDLDRAEGYSGNTAPFIVIPFDDSKIGVVNEDDLWQTGVTLFGDLNGIADHNDNWRRLQTVCSLDNENVPKGCWDFIVWLSNEIEKDSEDVVHAFVEVFGSPGKFNVSKFKQYLKDKTLLDYIDLQYSPSSTGFTVCRSSNKAMLTQDTEVWVDGKVVVISSSMWKNLRKAYIENS